MTVNESGGATVSMNIKRRVQRLLWLLALLLSIPMPCERARADGATPSSGLVIGAMFPANGAKDVCVDTPLRLTFNSPPTTGKGSITVRDAANNSVVQTIDVSVQSAMEAIGGVPHFKYVPVIISGNDATAYLPDGALAYNRTYLVTVDGGAFKNDVGDAAGSGSDAQWQFTTKAAAPESGSAKLTVAADGTGDFCSVQGAVDAVPDGNTSRTTIFIRRGTYTGIVFFRGKNDLTFTGEDRTQSVIAYANNAIFNPASDGGYHRGVFLAANCNGLVINNLTLRNTTRRGGSQAEALILNGNTKSRAIVANVDLNSFQDTLQINGQAYVSGCYIEGDVDFMWGSGPCFFEKCHCYGTRSKGYFTQIRNPAANHGYVYHDCIFDGPEGIGGMYLSRIAPSTFPSSEVVLINCVLGKAVSPIGWLLNAPKKGTTVPTTASNLHFWEFNSHAPDGSPVDTSRRLEVSRQLKMPDDAALIGDYSKPAFVLGNDWDAASDPNLPPIAKAPK
jgi:pectin methylesterase-like acyl-CoA thioesterase